MKLTLKDLKKNKGQKKDFKFLTPMIDLLKKEYKKILPEFDINMYSEAINEVIGDSAILAIYETPEKLRYASVSKGKRNYSITLKDSKEGTKFENMYLTLYNTLISPENALISEGHYWHSSYTTKLEDLYVITDTKAFEEFVFETMLEEEAKQIEDTKKYEAKKRKEVKDKKELLTKYGPKASTTDGRFALNLMKAMEEKDDKKKFDTLLKVVDYISDGIEEAVDNRY